MAITINDRTPEEIKLGLKTCAKGVGHCKECPYGFNGNGACAKSLHSLDLDALAYIQLLEDGIDRVYKQVDALRGLPEKIRQLKRERDAAVRTARWQFERRGKDGVTELPVCSGCGATPKYYAPKNDVGMQVPPYCHECGSKMAAVVKMDS